MKHEAVDYGYLPENIRNTLNLVPTARVSHQIMDMLCTGTVGPEAFPFSLRASLAESLFFASISTTSEEKEEQMQRAMGYKNALLNPNIQVEICQEFINTMRNGRIRAIKQLDHLKALSYAHASARWVIIRNSILKPPAQFKRISPLRVVK